MGVSSDFGDNAGSFIGDLGKVGAAPDFCFYIGDDIAGLAEADVGGDGPLGRVGILVRRLALDEGIEDGDIVPADGHLVRGLDPAGDDEGGGGGVRFRGFCGLAHGICSLIFFDFVGRDGLYMKVQWGIIA